MIKKRDLIFIAVLVLSMVLLFGYRHFFMGRGAVVRILIDGTVAGEYDLSADQEIRIEGYQGGENLLVIRGGEAFVESADCPDGLCVHQGKISSTGESIICLPHRVVVEIIGADAGETDAMVR